MLTSIPPRACQEPDAQRALALLLEEARHRSRVHTLALADLQGLLIAGAGRHAACEALSAEAPLRPREQLEREIDLGDERVLLCASSPLRSHELLDYLERECRRILAPARSALV